MPSVVIGGGEYNVGLHYLEEQDKQRRLALAQQAQQQDAYFRSQEMAMKQQQFAQESQYRSQQMAMQQDAQRQQKASASNDDDLRWQQFYAQQASQNAQRGQQQEEREYERNLQQTQYGDQRGDVLFNKNRLQANDQQNLLEFDWTKNIQQQKQTEQKQYHQESLKDKEEARNDQERMRREALQAKSEIEREKIQQSNVKRQQLAVSTQYSRDAAVLERKIAGAKASAMQGVPGADQAVAQYEQQLSELSRNAQLKIQQAELVAEAASTSEESQFYDEAGTGIVPPNIETAAPEAVPQHESTDQMLARNVFEHNQQKQARQKELDADIKLQREDQRAESVERRLNNAAKNNPSPETWANEVVELAQTFSLSPAKTQMLMERNPTIKEFNTELGPFKKEKDPAKLALAIDQKLAELTAEEKAFDLQNKTGVKTAAASAYANRVRRGVDYDSLREQYTRALVVLGGGGTLGNPGNRGAMGEAGVAPGGIPQDGYESVRGYSPTNRWNGTLTAEQIYAPKDMTEELTAFNARNAEREGNFRKIQDGNGTRWAPDIGQRAGQNGQFVMVRDGNGYKWVEQPEPEATPGFIKVQKPDGGWMWVEQDPNDPRRKELARLRRASVPALQGY
jgi:hypothetical protein